MPVSVSQRRCSGGGGEEEEEEDLNRPDRTKLLDSRDLIDVRSRRKLGRLMNASKKRQEHEYVAFVRTSTRMRGMYLKCKRHEPMQI
jgi:hypothetical protein